MATKNIRTIKFTYNLNTYTQQIYIDTNEEVNIVELFTIRRTIAGNSYKFTTGSTREWIYKISSAGKELFDFFNDAFDASDTYDIVFQFEEDDGTFTSYNVLLEQPKYNHELMGNSDSSDTNIAYRDFSIRILQK